MRVGIRPVTFNQAFSVSPFSPWLIGCAVGGGAAALSLLTDEGPLPLKLFLALSSGCLSALGSAARNAKKRQRRQANAALRIRRAEQPTEDLPAGADFRSDMGRRSAIAARARFEASAYGGTPTDQSATAPEGRSAIDISCDELERSLASGSRRF